MFKKGFVSLPFLILFTISISLCAYLSYKTMQEISIMESLKEVNAQIQKERLVIEQVKCILLCDSFEDQMISIDDEEVWLQFSENTCIAYGTFGELHISFQPENKAILTVSIE